MQYILDENNNPVLAPDILTWGKWFEEAQKTGRRNVGKDEVDNKYRVSTVFLGLDHNFGNGGPPVLWETMIFPMDDWGELYCDRYSSHEAAVEGHKKAVELAKLGKFDEE